MQGKCTLVCTEHGWVYIDFEHFRGRWYSSTTPMKGHVILPEKEETFKRENDYDCHRVESDQ